MKILPSILWRVPAIFLLGALSLFLFLPVATQGQGTVLSYDSSHCGQTVILSDGAYDQLLIYGAQCTDANPLTIRAQNEGRVFLDGQDSVKPCEIVNSSWVSVEGITCHNSPDMVVNINNSNNIQLNKVSAYQAGPDYGDHVFEIYRSSYVTLEDCAASGRGRNMYIAYESDFIEFRRCWGRYITNGTQLGAGWMQIYGAADSLIENCVGTRAPSDIYFDANAYWYATWNRDQDRVDRNRTVGSVFLGHDYHGLNVISANQQLHGNAVENSVFIGNDDPSMGFGIPYTGIFQRVDDDFTMDRLTLVNHQIAVNLTHDTSNPWFDIIGTLTNSSILNSSTGINIAQYSEITTNLDHHHNNFHNVGQVYSGTSAGSGESTLNPNYDTATYGKGAYLFAPPDLKGLGEGGADLGAEVLFQTVDKIANGERLWPWPLEARICAETANLLGDGVNGQSVTYESHQVQYDFDGDGQAEPYNCTGGIWKTLNGVYDDGPTPPTLLSIESGIEQLTVTWSDEHSADPDVVGYNLYHDEGGVAQLVASLGLTTSYVDTDLTGDQEYCYKVTSHYASGESGYSNILCATPSAPPPVPTLLSVESGIEQATVTWSDEHSADPDVVGYNLYHDEGGVAQLVASLGLTTSYVDTGLTGDQEYCYKVTSRYTSNESGYSNILCTTPWTPPPVPTLVSAEPGPEQVSLTWSDEHAADSDVVGYNLYYDEGGVAHLVASLGLITSYVDTGLTGDQEYCYKVTSRYASDESGYSNILCASPIHTPVTYYVATDGDDTNPGTEPEPFLTMARGISALLAGDVLYVRAGIYEETLGDFPSGTSWGTPVTIAAFPGDHVVVRPVSGSYVAHFTQCHYVILDGFILDGGNITQNVIRISSEGHHVRIQNSEVMGAPGSGILVMTDGIVASDSNEFLHLEIHDNGKTHNDHGVHLATSDNLVDGCEIRDGAGWGVHIFNDAAGGSANNNVVSNSEIHDNGSVAAKGWGIRLSSGTGNLAYNNVLWGNSGGILIGHNGSGTQAYNNTLYANGDTGILIESDSVNASVRNNIVFLHAVAGISDLGTGTIQDHNFVDTDPVFVDAAAHNFHLHPSSLAIDVGATLGEVPDDFDAVPRPRGVGYDVGAFESHISIAAPVPEIAPPEPGPEQITITWNSQLAASRTILQAPAQVTGYNIYYDLPEGELFLDSVGLTTSYVDTGLTAGQEYCYLVTSLEPEGESRFGSAQCAVASQPTSVSVAGFTAQSQDDGNLITWQTASETNLVGFDLYRGEGQDEAIQHLNEALIPAHGPGSPSGWAYEHLDTTATPGVTYYYWIDAVDAYGQAVRHGPAVAWSHRAFLPTVVQNR